MKPDFSNAPWRGAYPPGLAPEVELDAYPVHDLVDRAANLWPDKPALTFRDHRMTYAELKVEVDRSAAAFATAGVRKGTTVALLLPNTTYHPLAFFGVVKAGGRAVHLSPIDADRVALHKLSDSGARILVTTNVGDLADRAAGWLRDGYIDRLIVARDEALGQPDQARPVPSAGGITDFADFLDTAKVTEPPPVALDDIALLQYTGGTTGMPKGAMLTHRNLSSAVSSYGVWWEAWGLSRPAGDRAPIFLPLFHIYALTAALLRGVGNGSELVIHQRFDAETAVAEIERGATIMLGVPTMWIAIASLPGIETRNLSSLRYAASGGAPLPVEVARKLKSLTGLDILGGWGMTETSPAGTGIPINRPERVDSIGVPMPGMYIDIVAADDPAKTVPSGTVGEIRIFGPNVTSGYLNRPEETEKSFADGGLLTGDLGFMDDDGFITIVDRKKDMLLCGGFNVYPQMIEQAIYEHPAVEEALVIGIADAYRGESPKAFVKLRAGSQPLSLDDLRAFLKGRIGPHEMPTALEIRDALPRTPVGKLSKLELREAEAKALANTPATMRKVV